ncbi:MAG: hypothetical protein UW68_C0036G0006 [Candidatus Collierbacteria bacterium GW2011_GWB1_44_6]|uniref:Cytidyltransferase-like domain-containing protein n=2 Tax=Candidatus Collieribacteriota TaxID=1752725 RepID=A0A0G1JM70_9BACT|nr:MAG: hypothetical protein UV68_C0005G0006 [Candidatus Collierbacteria bacterium GW2011_GWC2_43_12]KKT72475.1 MAG: hypothetical protein UW68_C0036G0006 [Candidatus Collierbacteria bacterium GW2011_GWB1_44_6]KKT81221.1 MAG: hypothetical protein UW80_C0055G0007 [Microgenomates group bacterium GW2011_GWC1_44_9]
MENKKTYHVFLGRFAPLHVGHQRMINTLIARHSAKNILLLIGSSNSYNSRTPYTYEERKSMIEAAYPGVRVLPFPDINPSKIFFDGSTNGLWLDRLEKLADKMEAKFIFYGGCAEDLAVLSERFQVEIVHNRDHKDHGESATQVRQALETSDDQILEKMLNPEVLPLAKAGYARFKKQSLVS